MAMILITCPVTGQSVSTGLLMSADEFERAALDDNVIRCPACGRIHKWSKPDARLEKQEDSPKT